MAFYLILDKVQIHKRREGWFNPAEVRFYSFVSNKLISLPDLDILLGESNPAELRSKVREMSKDIVNQWESVVAENIWDDHVFTFGKTGKALFESQEIPERLDWTFLAIEDEQGTRDFGKDIDKILPDDKLDSLAGNLLKIARVASTPQITAAIEIGKVLVRGFTYFLTHSENDQLGLIEQSFIRELHYPNGKMFEAGVYDQTSNMRYDYSLFGV